MPHSLHTSKNGSYSNDKLHQHVISHGCLLNQISGIPKLWFYPNTRTNCQLPQSNNWGQCATPKVENPPVGHKKRTFHMSKFPAKKRYYRQCSQFQFTMPHARNPSPSTKSSFMWHWLIAMHCKYTQTSFVSTPHIIVQYKTSQNIVIEILGMTIGIQFQQVGNKWKQHEYRKGSIDNNMTLIDKYH